MESDRPFPQAPGSQQSAFRILADSKPFSARGPGNRGYVVLATSPDMTPLPPMIEPHHLGWLAQMEGVLEVLNEGVVITRDRNRIVFANSRFTEMICIPKQELVGCDVSRFYSQQEWEFLTQQSEVARRQGSNRYEFVLPRRDGARLPVIISSRYLENAGARFSVLTFTDISRQVRVEEELRAANAALEKRQLEIEEDLRLAARVQSSLAPKPLVRQKLRVESYYHPVHSVGGDFALVSPQGSDDVSLLVCDVSGHGIGSALVANRIYSETTAHLRGGMPFTNMLGELNRFLLEDIPGSGMFVTLAAARIKPRNGAWCLLEPVIHRRWFHIPAEPRCFSSRAAWFSARYKRPWTQPPAYKCSSNPATASSCTPTESPKSSIRKARCWESKGSEKSYAKRRHSQSRK